MEGTKLSRRQFLGGTAAVAAASVLPAVTSAAPAMATSDLVWTSGPDAIKATIAATPLDPKAIARKGFEIYRGMHSALGQSG
ncbi:MAG: twin-arginine translocation signal domain-containing protein [Coriobacteriia bacterium]|nr:twin-arginine translocation signal domain-containing protein [Coriobacteriia bacterium]